MKNDRISPTQFHGAGQRLAFVNKRSTPRPDTSGFDLARYLNEWAEQMKAEQEKRFNDTLKKYGIEGPE